MATHDRYNELFERNFPDVMAYALRRSSSRQDAEDLTAETFAVAWRRIDEVPVGDRARLWLFGTARLVRMNQQRSRQRHQDLLSRVRNTLRLDGPAPPDAQVAERDRLHRALARLRPLDREVLQLHGWEDLSSGEIAAVLEVDVQTVWKRLQRARDRFATALEETDGRASSRPTANRMEESCR